MSEILFSPDRFRAFTCRIFEKAGMSSENARIVSEALIDANLRGVASHGVIRIEPYIERIKKGGAALEPTITIERETPFSAVLNGGNGLGMVVSDRAVRIAKEKAERTGFSCVTVHNSNHNGAQAYWAGRLAGDDMIGFACSNVEPYMVVPGSKEPTIGNNPFGFVIPAGRYPALSIDMATSQVAMGKILNYQVRGMKIPSGWAVDKDGLPTTDPDSVATLVPFSEHKGYAVAAVVETFTSLLSGGCIGGNINSMYGDPDKPNEVSHCFMAMDIAAFREPTKFRADVDEFIEYLHTRARAGESQIYYPGELEHMAFEQSMKRGLSLPEELFEKLKSIAAELGVEQEWLPEINEG